MPLVPHTPTTLPVVYVCVCIPAPREVLTTFGWQVQLDSPLPHTHVKITYVVPRCGFPYSRPTSSHALYIPSPGTDLSMSVVLSNGNASNHHTLWCLSALKALENNMEGQKVPFHGCQHFCLPRYLNLSLERSLDTTGR